MGERNSDSPSHYPQPKLAVLGQTFFLYPMQHRYKSMNSHTGLHDRVVNWSFISIIQSILCKSSTTEPCTLGTGPPYIKFLPREKVNSGMANLLVILSTALSWSVKPGQTVTLGTLRLSVADSASGRSFGSMEPERAESMRTASWPRTEMRAWMAVVQRAL